MRSITRVEARRLRKRGDYLAAAAALFAALVLGAVVTAFVILSRDLDEANQARDALAQQVESLGQEPVAGPPGSRGEPGKAVVGPSGPPGPTGPEGSTGPTGPVGPSGKPAPTITPEPGAPGEPGPPGPTGPAGPPGRDGVDGADGADGQDGRNGTDGQDGKNGQPPAGWTYTDPKGVTYTCTRVAGFDPAAPRYECKPASEPDPDQQPPNSSVLGLAPDRRRY